MKEEKKTQRLFSKYIEDETLGMGFWLIVGDYDKTIKKIKKIIQNKDFNYSRGGAEGMFLKYESNSGDRYNFLWIGDFDWTIESIGILCHELIHRAFETAKQLDFRINSNNEELFAYHYEDIIKKVLRVLNRANLKGGDD